MHCLALSSRRIEIYLKDCLIQSKTQVLNNRDKIQGLQDHIKSLTEVVTTVVGRASSIDPGALLNTLHDLKSHTSAQLQALEANAKIVDQRTHHLMATEGRKSLFGVKFYVFFLVGQALVLIIYNAVKGKMERNKKYL